MSKIIKLSLIGHYGLNRYQNKISMKLKYLL